MITFFLYLIKSVLCLALFYPFYMVLLSRETFHRFNRMALIGILLASVIIPACRITTEEPMLLSQLYQRWENWLTGQEPATDNTNTVVVIDWTEADFAPAIEIAEEEPFSLIDFMSEHWSDLLFMLYVAGILFLVGRHLVSTVRLFGLLRQGRMQRLDDGSRLYLHTQSDIAPFSWMKYIVISESDYLENGKQIVAHEQAHISNGHSWDLLLVEVCLLAQWFNPAAWLLRQELQDIHEYEADDTVLRRGINAKEYQLLIIKKAVGARLYSLANSLNHSSLKKRLTMMMKEKSHPWARLKYLYVLPLAAISLVAFAHTEAANNSNSVSEAKITEFSANSQTSSVESSDNDAKKVKLRCRLVNADTGEPVYGANVAVRGTGRGTVSDKEGRFEIEVDPTKDVINVSYVGMSGASIKMADGHNPNVEHTIKMHPTELTADMLWEEKNIDHIKLNGPVRHNEKEGQLEVNDAEPVFMVVENMPEFPGGTAELMKFLSRNLKYPAEARQKGEQGRVVLSFIVGKDGKLRNFEVKKSVSPALDAEAVRVAKSMPDWKPGRQRGMAVDCKFNIPVQFSLQGKEAPQKQVSNETLPIPHVQVTSKGEFLYGHDGTKQKGSLEEVANYVNDVRKEVNSAGKGAHFKVQLVAEKGAPQESVDKLKEALRKIHVLQITTYQKASDEVFQVVEKMPEFPGGMGELMNYLAKNIKYPTQAMKDSIQGRVIVQFVISKTGEVINPSILRSVSPELDAEAIRVVSSMPLWTPGEQKGEAVNVKFTLPIQFRLAKPKDMEKHNAEKMAKPNGLSVAVMGNMKTENKVVTKDAEGRVLSEVMLPANASQEEIDAATQKAIAQTK